MKLFFLSVFIGLLPSIFWAQNDKIIYLDSLGLETTNGNHASYRTIKNYYLTQKSYTVLDYYNSGKLKSEGLYLDQNGKQKEGTFIEYYENGNQKSRKMYSENILYGDCAFWYENGNKKIEGEFTVVSDDKFNPLLKIYNYWAENNELKISNGQGILTEILENETASGEIKNGYKQGLWEGASQKPIALTFKEYYEKGKLIEGTATDSLGTVYKYTKTEKVAQPKGGMQNFYKVFATNVKIPQVSENIDQIKFLFSFTVDEYGKITDIKTLKGYDKKTNKNFIKLLSDWPNWNPAEHRGIKIKSQFTLPITVQISSNYLFSPTQGTHTRFR
ncbi:hypothetical protein ABGT15_11495 [Flavobacterium enshiense]|uniref:toxin-antitoxin system YwqK family antitoxin n=1 Tax=Flavobacterium enshiense TaxID=1341165 RepID=UPI00345C9FD0